MRRPSSSEAENIASIESFHRASCQVWVVAALMLAACSSDPNVFGSSEATSSSSGGAVCVPGQQSQCACSGEETGTQVCKADGSGFEPCACGSGGAGGGGGSGGSRPVCDPGETLPCYSGPDGTNGVGLCVAGVATCDSDGSAWGPCTGEVTPKPETCSTPGDDDCDGQPNEEGADCSCSPGAQQDCYSAPPSTEDVGPCHGGLQQCNAQGNGFGPCVGEIAPIMETCNTVVDDDCDGKTNEEGDGCVCLPGSMSSCYDGASGTEGVGACQGGMHTCNDQGTGFGVCNGQVLPLAFDLCSTAVDDDCDGSSMPCTVNPPWSKRFGSGSPIGLAVDGAGNIFIGAVGSDSDFDFGGGVLSGNFAIAKLDPQGNHIWSKGFSIGTWSAYGMNIDSNGNVLAVGSFQGLLDLGGPALYSEGAGAFVLKLDAAGNHVWSNGYPGTLNANGITAGTAVAADSTGAVYVGGRFGSNGVDLGGGLLQSNGLGGDGFLLKLTSSGSHVWSKKLDSSYGGEVKSIAADGIDNVFVTGWFSGTLAFGGVSSAGGSADVFLAKLDPGGAAIWSKAFGDTSTQYDAFVALDAAGNPSVAGRYEGTIDLGGGPFTSQANWDDWAAKFDSAGNHVWSRAFGNGEYQEIAVAVDASGHTLLAGSFGATIDWGPGALTSSGASDVFFATYSTTGNGLTAARYGDFEAQYGQKIAVDGLGAPIVAGTFLGTLDFGAGGAVTAVSNTNDLFVAKLAP